MTDREFSIRPLAPADREWVRQKMIEEWEAEFVITHGASFQPAILPGFIAELSGEIIGLLTYHIKGKSCEIVTLNSWHEGVGAGTALIGAVKQAASQAGCGRLFLVTTNNNLHALRFYQKRGFVISTMRINAIAGNRKLKPEIPLFDEEGLPIRDEIELEIML